MTAGDLEIDVNRRLDTSTSQFVGRVLHECGRHGGTKSRMRQPRDGVVRVDGLLTIRTERLSTTQGSRILAADTNSKETRRPLAKRIRSLPVGNMFSLAAPQRQFGPPQGKRSLWIEAAGGFAAMATPK
jgi:hypothetical protein